jgi:hypothetical protein
MEKELEEAYIYIARFIQKATTTQYRNRGVKADPGTSQDDIHACISY